MTTCLDDSLCAVSATSYAAPHVAAAAALLRSYNSSWSAPEIRRRLWVGAHDLGSTGYDIYFGHGRLDIAGALSAAAPSVPSISIDGPTDVKPSASCVWFASVSGGAAPLTYEWGVGSMLVGNQQELTYANSVSHGGSFLLRLTVTGADFAQSTTSVTVSVSSGAMICPI